MGEFKRLIYSLAKNLLIYFLRTSSSAGERLYKESEVVIFLSLTLYAACGLRGLGEYYSPLFQLYL